MYDDEVTSCMCMCMYRERLHSLTTWGAKRETRVVPVDLLKHTTTEMVCFSLSMYMYFEINFIYMQSMIQHWCFDMTI